MMVRAGWVLLLGGAALAGCLSKATSSDEGAAGAGAGAPASASPSNAGTTGEGDDAGLGSAPVEVPQPVTTEPVDAGAVVRPEVPVGVQGTAAARGELDLLFMIDNSLSMGDKQETLRLAAADLLEQLTRPACLDAAGVNVGQVDEAGACPAGSEPAFVPFDDLHVAVISSSLGDGGAQAACPSDEDSPQFVPDRADMAHTMGSLQRGMFIEDNSFGFLEWRRGDASSFDRFVDNFADMVGVVGEQGCGWEASLESWYRFLVDPFPYQRLVRVRCPGSASEALNCVAPATNGDGILIQDDVLLQQRANFLRPTSTVAIVMLTDENDCSFRVGDQRWVVLNIDDQRAMFRGSSVCDTNPNDTCCYSCPVGRLAGPPEGCGALDPRCEEDLATGALQDRLSPAEDGRNLRCFQQKRRFGIDFLYPTERYVNALTRAELCWSRADLDPNQCDEDPVPNPLYAEGRSSDSVFLSGVLGVPWQDLAAERGATGAELQANELRYKPARELAADGTWDAILGDPGLVPNQDTYPTESGTPPVAPLNPVMIESEFERPGVSVNAINGRDYDTGQAGGIPDDLQYACIFPLPQPRDCALISPIGGQTCDCFDGFNDRPLCEAEPGVSEPSTVQHWAKAYPASRQLHVLREFGDNAVVSSICARNTSDPDQPDFGYRPAASALVEALGSVEIVE